METISLKALANKVLQRNSQGNLVETNDKINGNFQHKKVSKLFEKKFNELAEWLSQFDLTADEIKTQRPKLYKQIQNAINEMDTAWLKGDLTEFLKAIETINNLYFNCLREML